MDMVNLIRVKLNLNKKEFIYLIMGEGSVIIKVQAIRSYILLLKLKSLLRIQIDLLPDLLSIESDNVVLERSCNEMLNMGLYLPYTNLSGVSLKGVDLSCANLLGANLSRANLFNVRLQEMELLQAKLNMTIFNIRDRNKLETAGIDINLCVFIDDLGKNVYDKIPNKT